MPGLVKVPIVDIDRELIERNDGSSLFRFTRMAWPIIETSPYQENWHLPLLCEHLEAVSNGEIKRLVVNMPPGTMKSLNVSVFWPVWEWIKRQDTRWMFASYDASLVGTVQGGKVIDILQSEWFIERWGALLKDKNPASSMFDIHGGGFRFATSPGGKGTGRHVDIQVIDDPNKPTDVQGSQALTKKAIANTSMWFKGTASTRSRDAETFRRVIVMQRLHEDDLAGEMLREGGWVHLCIPMRYESTTVCICNNPLCTPQDPRTEDGELLWESRFPESVVKHQETVGLGPSNAASQYQQRPTPASGGIFQKGWFRYWHNNPGEPVPKDDKYPCRDKICEVLPTDGGIWLQSWDMTFKGTDGSDFVAGGVWYFKRPNYFLVYQICKRMTFIESLQAVLDVSRRYPESLTKLIEDKANGTAVMDVLTKEIPGLVPVDPQGGKESRAHAVSGLFEAGNVFIPHDDLASWVPDYRVQVSTFPRGVNDDMVDQTTQALLRLKLHHVPFLEAMRVVKGQLT